MCRYNETLNSDNVLSFRDVSEKSSFNREILFGQKAARDKRSDDVMRKAMFSHVISPFL